MVNATIDNEPVSISLGAGESTTVPDGEVWDVTINGGSGRTDDLMTISINGESIGSAGDNFGPGDDPGTAHVCAPTVLTGGDTIELSNQGEEEGAHIGGYVVNS